MKFLYNFKFPTLSLLTSILPKYYKHQIHFPFFHHLLRIIIFFFPKKVIGTSIFKIQIENYVRKRKEPPMIQIRPFKEKEKEGGEGRSQLDDQWKISMLGGSCKVPMFGGQWKEKEKEKEKHFFTSSHFPPTNFT